LLHATPASFPPNGPAGLKACLSFEALRPATVGKAAASGNSDHFLCFCYYFDYLKNKNKNNGKRDRCSGLCKRSNLSLYPILLFFVAGGG